MPVSPILERQTTYPFVRLNEAARRVEARGIDVIGFDASEAMVAYLNCQRALTGTLSGGTSVATPPGYDKAIVTNLAVELGFGGFGAQPTQSLVLAARESKMLLENMNYRPLIMDTIMSGDSDYDIRAWP